MSIRTRSGRIMKSTTQSADEPSSHDTKEKEKPYPISRSVNPQEVVYFTNRFPMTAVLPVFPPGVLSLLGALLVLFGIGLLTYVAIAQGDALNERMDAAAIALNNIWHRLWHGEISSLNQLVIHPDVRAWAGMYIGALVAAAGFYFAYVMDTPTFVSSFPDPSVLLSIPSRERLVEEMMIGLQKISSINGISTGISGELSSAPTPALSVSTIVRTLGGEIRRLLRPFGHQNAKEQQSQINNTSETLDSLGENERNTTMPSSPSSSSWRNTMTATIDAAADEGRAKLKTLTLFLSSSAPRYRKLTWLQKLDVIAGVSLVLSLLFWAVLHAGNIQHIGSHLIPYLPHFGGTIAIIGLLRVFFFLIDLVINKKLQR